jgi:hypothetical protein
MWYVSGNRDETMIPDADRFIIDRAKPRQHLAFGYGIHRCAGARLAELQLAILWEEILARDLKLEVLAKPRRVFSNFIGGITSLPRCGADLRPDQHAGHGGRNPRARAQQYTNGRIILAAAKPVAVGLRDQRVLMFGSSSVGIGLNWKEWTPKDKKCRQRLG